VDRIRQKKKKEKASPRTEKEGGEGSIKKREVEKTIIIIKWGFRMDREEVLAWCYLCRLCVGAGWEEKRKGKGTKRREEKVRGK